MKLDWKVFTKSIRREITGFSDTELWRLKVSKYNLGQYEKCALTIADLCEEIAEKNPNSGYYSFNTLRDKFENNEKMELLIN